MECFRFEELSLLAAHLNFLLLCGSGALIVLVRLLILSICVTAILKLLLSFQGPSQSNVIESLHIKERRVWAKEGVRLRQF